METEEKTGCKGGCACKQTTRPCNEVSKSEPISISDCPECQGVLKFGSRDPCEGDLWWCSACGYGPITYPLFGGPAIKQITSAKELLGIIDSDKANEALRIVEALKARPAKKRPVITEEPMPGYVSPSPHPFMDGIVAKINEGPPVINSVLNDEDKKACFGAFNYHGCVLPCVWEDRCRQSQEDY